MLKKGSLYTCTLNGASHKIQISDSGKYLTIVGNIFQQQQIFIPTHTLDTVENNTMIGFRTTQKGVACYGNAQQEYFANNAFSMTIANIKEVVTGE